MLHYKYLGVEYIMNRHAKPWERLSELNKLQRWGHHNDPQWTGTYSTEWFQDKYPDRVKAID